ncbi:MAG TPA: glycoside hydrolase family 15 protein [Pyrinomonadaceae bacterium]|nr:glycoside hydrolase family 15 protein [Pyrinomonadaceae bacterium]
MKLNKNYLIYLFLYLCLCVSAVQMSFAQEKGKGADWESAGKQAIGTAFSEKSKVWFTLEGGALTEVFYPTADKANVQWLQFVIFNPKTKKVETERDDAIHQIRTLRPDSLSFQQINKSKTDEWTIIKTYATDVERDSILIDVQFQTKNKNLELYVYFNPSLDNSGMEDSAFTGEIFKNSSFSAKDFQREARNKIEEEQKEHPSNFFDYKFNRIAEDTLALYANDKEINSALAFSSQISKIVNGYFGKGDGLERLKSEGEIIDSVKKADGSMLKLGIHSQVEDGNVTQLAKIDSPKNFTAYLSFGKTRKATSDNVLLAMSQGFKKIQREYERRWSDYVKTLPKIDPKYQTQFNYSAMALRAMEDKTYRGGNVASLSKPWIPKGDANGPYVSGYHLVWSRDLYQVASAYIAMGDKDSANRALDYLFTKQQKADGSYPQMTWLDGRVVGDSLQMDEVSYPLILAYQLGRNDHETYEKHIKPTADFIVKTGPTTKQERWEEKPGYSPATIAAEIAGLVCAADIAQKNGDDSSAKIWLEKADNWAENVEKWTATTKGKYGDGNYYLRLTKNGTPDAGDKIELNNGAGTWLENEIIDAGFLELVRLGIKSPNDPLIVKSLKVVDEVLKVETPNGAGFYRYNHDGYGEYEDGRNWNYDKTWTGKGHLWALLTGERGQYEIALGNWFDIKGKSRPSTPKDFAPIPHLTHPKPRALDRLITMSKFANDGMMIPEQVWDKPNGVFPFGEGARSATPLAWSMAQFIRLAMNLKAGKNLDTPEVVARRYGN